MRIIKLQILQIIAKHKQKNIPDVQILLTYGWFLFVCLGFYSPLEIWLTTLTDMLHNDD